MKEVPWLEKARYLVGLKEIKGSQHEPKILALAVSNHTEWVHDDETAWCATFVGGILEQCGVRGTRSLAARSYLHWGIDCTEADRRLIPLGAIAVFSRDPNPTQGHVGFAVGHTDAGDLMVLGGNQSDSVSIAPIAGHRLLATRWPLEMRPDIRFSSMLLPLMERTGALSTNEA